MIRPMDPEAPPLYIASGPWSDPSLCDPSLVQGIVTKSVTWESRDGNPGDTVQDLGMGAYLNWQGLPNGGCEAFCVHGLPRWRDSGHRFIVSVAGQTLDDYLRCAELLLERGVSALELNLSCPNAPGVDLRILSELVPQISASCDLFVKLAPNPFALDDAIAAVRHMAGQLVGVVCGNSLPAAVVTKSGSLQHGGMSGAWLKPVAMGMAHAVSTKVDIPVIGCGGVRAAEDVQDFLTAGCVAVQLGSVCLDGAEILVDVVADLVSVNS